MKRKRNPNECHDSMVGINYDQAERMFRDGRVSYNDWEEWRCHWRNGCFRWSEIASQHDGHDPNHCPLIDDYEVLDFGQDHTE